MNPDTYMPFFGNEFYNALEGQNEHVEVAYCRALWYYWSHTHCKGIADNDTFLRKLCHCEVIYWRDVKEIVFGQFFRLEDGLWHQKRAHEEWARIVRSFEAKSKAGKASAARRWGLMK